MPVLGWLVLVAGLCLGSPKTMAAPASDEAKDIVQFCNMVTWPPEVQSQNRLVITVVGKSELSDAVKKLDHTSVGSREIEVQEVANPQQAEIAGGVLVLGQDQQQNVSSILDSIKGQPILTVADAGKFASQGGSIEFYQDNGNVCFHVNKDAFDQAGLTADPHLMDLADHPGSAAAVPAAPQLTSAVSSPTVASASLSPMDAKADAIYQFCKEMTWPPEVQSQSQVVITIVGKSELNDAVKKLDGKPIGARTVHVEQISDLDQSDIAGGVLILGGDLQESIPNILAAIQGQPILTVGDAWKFVSLGGGIEFYQDNGSLCYHVNKDAFDQAGLTPDPHLLAMADHASPSAVVAVHTQPKLSSAPARGAQPTATPVAALTLSERKAAAIYQFCKLCTWPSEIGSSEPLLVTVIGKSELNDAVKELDQASLGGRVIHVREVMETDQSEVADGVLVIDSDQVKNIPTILESIKGHPILTVGDTGQPDGGGVGIGFYMDQGHLRFHVNKDDLEQAGLNPDPHLLELADRAPPTIAKTTAKTDGDGMPCCHP